MQDTRRDPTATRAAKILLEDAPFVPLNLVRVFLVRPLAGTLELSVESGAGN
jgi:hypothetical protein